MGAWGEGEGSEGCDVRQAAARAATGGATHRDDDEDIVAGRVAAVQADRIRCTRGACVLSFGRGGQVYGGV